MLRRASARIDVARRLQRQSAVASSASEHTNNHSCRAWADGWDDVGEDHMRRVSLAVLACAILLPSAAVAQRAPDLRKPAGKEWLTIGGDWGNTRYSTLTQ